MADTALAVGDRIRILQPGYDRALATVDLRSAVTGWGGGRELVAVMPGPRYLALSQNQEGAQWEKVNG